MATVSAFAAPSGTARPHSDLCVASLRWASRNPRNWRQLRSSQPPGTARPHSNMRMALLRWTPRGLTNVATVSLFAAPRDGEASFGIACDTTPPGLPGAHKRGDSLTVRSQGRRGLLLIRVGHHAAGQAKSKRRWPHFRCSQPPGTARLHSDLRMRSLRWTRLQPTKVANISQFAAPQGRQGLILICV